MYTSSDHSLPPRPPTRASPRSARALALSRVVPSDLFCPPPPLTPAHSLSVPRPYLLIALRLHHYPGPIEITIESSSSCAHAQAFAGTAHFSSSASCAVPPEYLASFRFNARRMRPRTPSSLEASHHQGKILDPCPAPRPCPPHSRSDSPV